jgi:diguanylate cyclase (GGDEF)-like protein
VRIGGDEFVIFLPNAGNGAADQLADRFQEALTDLNREENRAFIVTASAGFAVVKPDRLLSIEECIRASDRELYKIKAMHNKV